MANLNKLFLIGNLCKNPESSTCKNGRVISKFPIAVNRHFTVDGAKREETAFIDCTAFGPMAETLNKYLSKGRMIFLEGRIELQQWTAKDGGKRSKVAMVIESFQFLSDGQDRSTTTEAPAVSDDGAAVAAALGAPVTPAKVKMTKEDKELAKLETQIKIAEAKAKLKDLEG